MAPNSSPNKTPTWLKWGMGLFIVYALITHWAEKNELPASLPATESTEAAIPAEGEKNPKATSDEGVVGFMDKVFPGSVMGMQTQEIKEGMGEPAACGQNVRVRYETFLKDGTKIESNRDAAAPLQFTLGRGKALPALHKAVLDMKKGGERVAMASSRQAYDAEGFARPDVPPASRVKLSVELVDVTPALPTSEMGVRVFDDRAGAGTPAACGDKVAAHFVVWSAAGKKLYDSKAKHAGKPVEVVLGGGQVSYGLEQGVLGMRLLGKRSLVIAPELLSVFNPEGALPASAELSFGKREAVIVDVELVEIK